MSDFEEIDSSTNDYESSERNSHKSNDLLIIDNISDILLSLIEENKNLYNYEEEISKQKKSIFFSSEIPSISIKAYLYRIHKYTEVEYNTLILALIYIDKICEKASIILSEFNIHQILFTSIIIAIKYNEDLCYYNKYYAKIAGVTPKELQKMEGEFLRLIKFELYINKKIFDKYRNYINKINAINKMLKEKKLIL
jgi:hypothetical protein